MTALVSVWKMRSIVTHGEYRWKPNGNFCTLKRRTLWNYVGFLCGSYFELPNGSPVGYQTFFGRLVVLFVNYGFWLSNDFRWRYPNFGFQRDPLKQNHFGKFSLEILTWNSLWATLFVRFFFGKNFVGRFSSVILFNSSGLKNFETPELPNIEPVRLEPAMSCHCSWSKSFEIQIWNQNFWMRFEWDPKQKTKAKSDEIAWMLVG